VALFSCKAKVASGFAVVSLVGLGIAKREIIQSVDLALIGCEAEVARGLEAALSWALPGWSPVPSVP